MIGATAGIDLPNVYDDFAEPDASQRLVLDIETCRANEDDLAIEREVVKPHGGIKDVEKKQENLLKKQANISEKDGLLDSNPVACIGVMADNKLLHFSNGFDFSDAESAKLRKKDIQIVQCATEADMLWKFRKFVEARCDETIIVTHNGYGFDFPRLRFAYGRNRLRMPSFLNPFQANTRHIDLMIEFGKHYTVNADLKKFVTLETVCKLYKIPFKKAFNGKDVLTAIANKEFYRVTIYNLNDVIATAECADVMGVGVWN